MGAKDFINKSVEIDELVCRLKSVFEGCAVKQRPAVQDPLTDRERQVLNELIKGTTKKTSLNSYLLANELCIIISRIFMINLTSLTP